jgi:membrane-associated phospholipid phosphatase
MWVGVVYLGEHYVFDVIVGALYALTAYVASNQLFKWYNQPERLLRRKVDTFKARLIFWRS